MPSKDKQLQAGDLYKIADMPHDEATKYIRDNPEDIHDLMVLVVRNNMNGWMKRYEMNVQ